LYPFLIIKKRDRPETRSLRLESEGHSESLDICTWSLAWNPKYSKEERIGNLDLFESSGERRQAPTLLGPLEGLISASGPAYISVFAFYQILIAQDCLCEGFLPQFVCCFALTHCVLDDIYHNLLYFTLFYRSPLLACSVSCCRLGLLTLLRLSGWWRLRPSVNLV
jgi:hypothetical protein